jgi:hypothetical protein
MRNAKSLIWGEAPCTPCEWPDSHYHTVCDIGLEAIKGAQEGLERVQSGLEEMQLCIFIFLRKRKGQVFLHGLNDPFLWVPAFGRSGHPGSDGCLNAAQHQPNLQDATWRDAALSHATINRLQLPIPNYASRQTCKRTIRPVLFPKLQPNKEIPSFLLWLKSKTAPMKLVTRQSSFWKTSNAYNCPLTYDVKDRPPKSRSGEKSSMQL